jgi:MOSC domain-containing protein YiiM/ferredoxin
VTAARAPVLLSVNVGMPKDVPWQGKTVYTGAWKHPVAGPRMVRRLNIDGDGQGDLNGHGGEQRAVLVYQIQSYRHWQQHFGRNDFSYGMFGENLTVEGLPDDQVCIGDRYRIGGAEFEVTQPRVTCYRVGLRLGEPELPALLVSHHRPGFYMRVLTEGHIQAGDQIIKTRTGPGALSVADTDALLYLPRRDPARLRLAVRIPALSPGWQDSFRRLLAAAERGSTSAIEPPGAEPIPGPRPAGPGFRELRVTKVVPESAKVSSIYLAASDGIALPAARAGQYLTLRVPGAGQPAPVRSYSLSSAPGADAYRISVKHEPHGIASSYLNRNLQPGAVLDVAAPRGEFVLGDGAGPVLLGVDPDRIHTELFGALPSINPGLTGQNRRPPHQPDGPPGSGPLVTFARSGISAPFAASRRSVLELADACDVPTRWSCRSGVCHTCATPLLSGDVTYSPAPLEPPADGEALICCARPGTDIVLDM